MVFVCLNQRVRFKDNFSSLHVFIEKVRRLEVVIGPVEVANICCQRISSALFHLSLLHQEGNFRLGIFRVSAGFKLITESKLIHFRHKKAEKLSLQEKNACSFQT